MFHTLLIANRGEIACRVAATARRLGIKTVAVYSDVDANAKHVASCDAAVRVGAAPARESYLLSDAILRAALETGAQAVHPGYGFLSENEAFAEACVKAGIVFVGPPALAIAAMGSKSAAKTLMDKAGVPLVPGYHGEQQDPNFLLQQADSIGYPVLIKASSGGGGKGMRVVTSRDAFQDALGSCKREALSSFGDDKVLIERYLQKPRHIEIQVFADQHGNCIYLFERDCSVQRRHQKVIEEAPAPGMTAARRQAMGEAAVAAAKAVNYVGAGTVEFIVEPDGRFYFMEMNTRLQVEHPVTEMITGLDLVEWQLRIAAGQPLPLTQEQLQFKGHSIEVRIYAENPDNGFLPSVGTLQYLDFPESTAFVNGPVRIDGGIRAGDAISTYYDPMIAKLIVHGEDRDQARARMVQALEHTRIVGVHTNVAFLRRLMTNQAFAEGDLDTGLIEQHRDTLLPAAVRATDQALVLATIAVLTEQGAQSRLWSDPWRDQSTWRLAGLAARQVMLVDGESVRTILVTGDGHTRTFELEGRKLLVSWTTQSDPQALAMHVCLSILGQQHQATVLRDGTAIQVFEPSRQTSLILTDPLAQAEQGTHTNAGGMTAPMPGKVIAVYVQSGASVKRGDALLVMEAMKMEHTISAATDGVVGEVYFAVGDQVAEGVELLSVQSEQNLNVAS
jgi:3-methylcrotonyl-CoA carboxylase alpha subunit